VGVTLAALVFASASSAVPAPPFTECPAIGVDTSCGLLIDFTPSGTAIVADTTQGPYDASDDTLLGVKNDSSTSVGSVQLKSTSLDIFGFDGDGICSGAYTFTGSAGCPFLDSTYEYGGPGVTYTNISSNGMSGTVNFTPALAPGASTYFSLEDAIDPASVTAGPSFCTGSLTASDPAHMITGNVAHSLSLSGGTWVISGATVSGTVNLHNGASLEIINSKINGAVNGTAGGTLIISKSSVTGGVSVGAGEATEACGATLGGLSASSAPAGVQVCGSTVAGAIGVTGSTGFVVVGDPAQQCAPDHLSAGGSASFSKDLAGLDVSGNTIVGSLNVTRSGGPSAPLLAGNTIGGSLACSANTPPPIDGGIPNKSATRSGQCSAKLF
jgi:hypothetical protein